MPITIFSYNDLLHITQQKTGKRVAIKVIGKLKEIIDKQFVHFLYWLVPFINAVVYISVLLYELNPAFPVFKVNGIMTAIILIAVSYFLTRKIVADQEPAPRVLAYIFGGVGSILFLVSLFLF